MASATRNRSLRHHHHLPGIMDLNRLPSCAHGHEFTGGQSRVVMVRKTEQRTFASKGGEEPKFETVTTETVETFHGNRTQRVTTSEKRDGFKDLDRDFDSRLSISEIGTGDKSSSSPSSGALSPDKGGKPRADSKLGGLFKSKSKSDVDSDPDFASDCLKAHNEYRVRHGVEPLKLNKKICKYSEEWARHLAARGIMEHRQNSEYGENIFCSWSSDPNHKVTGREPVENWYNEIKDHPFGREPRDLRSGHFSQVVWKGSRELGVAMAKSNKGHIFVVANYSPPGNFIGNFAENVPPPVDSTQQNGNAASSQGKKASETTKSDSGGKTSGGSFEVEALKIHNEYRRKHGVPELKLSKEICSYATDWAKTLAKEDRFGHRPNCKYGENIFCAWSSDPNSKVSARDACDAWYNEIKDHQFGVEPRILKSGHFTQMIWKGSQEMGIGVARSRNGRTLVVANYNPRGNFIGQFVANVPRPQ